MAYLGTHRDTLSVDWCGSCLSLLESRLSSRVKHLPRPEGLNPSPMSRTKKLRLRGAVSLWLGPARADSEEQKRFKAAQSHPHLPCGGHP